MPIVTIKDVYKSFGADDVFAGLSCALYPSQKVGMVGANGTGKTTLLKLILGLEVPDTGQIIKRKGITIGYLPQEPVFDRNKTVMEQMHSGLEQIFDIQAKMQAIAEKMGALSGKEQKNAIAEYDRLDRNFELAGGYEYQTKIESILTGLGMGKEYYEVKISALSGGQMSRLGLAAALMSNADMLLLDEIGRAHV